MWYVRTLVVRKKEDESFKLFDQIGPVFDLIEFRKSHFERFFDNEGFFFEFLKIIF